MPLYSFNIFFKTRQRYALYTYLFPSRYVVLLGHRLAWWGSAKELDDGRKARGQLLLQVSDIAIMPLVSP